MTTASARKTAASRQPTNADLVRQGYAAFNAADIETLSRLFHKDCTWSTPGHGSIGGRRKGHQEVFTQFGRYGGETHGTFKAILQDVMESETGRVVAIHRNTGVRNGKTLDVMCCIVFDFENGQLKSGTEHFFDLHAWEDFWA